MSKNLIPEELQALIKQYLTDGVLTDKERAVILRKAESMGLDHDEIDLYLDAEVQKIEQAIDASARKQKGKTCPFCGGVVPVLADKCPHCGQSITPEASEELKEIFDSLEEALVNMKSRKDYTRSKASVERYARKAKMYYGNNPKVQKLLAEVEDEMKNTLSNIKAEERKNLLLSLVKNRWLWIGLLFVIGCFCFSFVDFEAEPDEFNGPLCLVAILFIIGALVAAMYTMNKEKDRKK